MNSYNLFKLSAISFALFSAMPAWSAAWHQAVSVPVSAEYDSNPTMAASDEEGVWRFRLLPRYTLTGTSGTDEYKVGLAVNLERSSDESLSQNRSDPSLLLGWRRQSELGEMGLTAKYDQASTRATELAESGLVAADSTRTSKSLSGNWRKALNERNSLAADLEYKDISYDSGSYNDYTNLSGGLKYSHAVSERAEAFLHANASRYNPDGTGFPSNNYGALVGMKMLASERLDWTAQVGLSRTTGNDDGTGWQGSYLLHYAGVRSDLNLEIGRYMNPSGEGGFAESDQVRASWGYAVDERTRAGVDAVWMKYKGLSANTTRQAGIWASRELTPFWSTRLSCTFKQRTESGAGDSSAYVIGLSLIYSHPDF